MEYFKQLAKALIRLRVCAGWSEPLLVAHNSLLEISCPGSNMFAIVYVMLCMYTIGEGPQLMLEKLPARPLALYWQ